MSFHPYVRPLRLTLALLATVLLGLASGCSHYQLGTGAGPVFKALYVEPVANKTLLPQAREIVSTRIRQEFIRDGRVRIVDSRAEADAVLSITIVGYHRDVAAVREGDTGLARKFDLTLSADCTLTQQDGKVLFDRRNVVARREAFTDTGQLQSEYQALPLLADTLAARVTHATLDVW